MTGADQIRLEERQRQEQLRQQERQRQEQFQEQRLQEIRRDIRKNLYGALEDRGLPVPDLIRTRIEACDDITQLTRWLRRAVTASSAAAILEPSA